MTDRTRVLFVKVLRDAFPDDYRHRLVHIIHEATHRRSARRVA